MIVPSMTDIEVFREIDRDRESVRRWVEHQLRARRREVLKCRTFPKRVWLEYTSQRMVRYLIGVNIFDKKMQWMAMVLLALRRTNEGMAVYNTWLSYDDSCPQAVMTPHMWKQYAKRAGIDKSGVELVKTFFERNQSCFETYNQKVVGRSVRYNGEKHLSGCVKDGVLLGQYHEGNIHVVRTFITYDMCTGLQGEAFGAYQGKHSTYADVIEKHRKKPIVKSVPPPLPELPEGEPRTDFCMSYMATDERAAEIRRTLKGIIKNPKRR